MSETCPSCGDPLVKQEFRRKARIDPVLICENPYCLRYIVKIEEPKPSGGVS